MTAATPTTSKMAEPVALRGPAQGPPPIANNPSGSITEDNQHRYVPILKWIFAVAMFSLWSNLNFQYPKRFRLRWCRLLTIHRNSTQKPAKRRSKGANLRYRLVTNSNVVFPTTTATMSSMPGFARFGSPSKLLAITVGVVLALIVCWVVFSHLDASPSHTNNRDVAGHISRQLRSGAAEIDIGQAADFPWDEMFVFNPYYPKDDICKALKLTTSQCSAAHFRDV